MKLKNFSGVFSEAEIKAIVGETYTNMDEDIEFEAFLRVGFPLVQLLICYIDDKQGFMTFMWELVFFLEFLVA